MKNLIVFLSVAVAFAAASDDLLDVKNYTEAVMQRHFVRPQEAATVYGQCLSIPFQLAQSTFNDALNISTDITWRQSNSLNYRVNKILMNDGKGPEGLLQVCNARSMFVNILGATYPWCVNRFYLLGQGDTTFDNVIYYVHLYKHLEFICSAAFNVYAYNNNCIAQTQQLPAYNQCLTDFNTANNQNYNALCSNADTLTKCMQNLFTNYCDVPTGWTQCEVERVGFAYDCPNLACSLPVKN